jgi:hypothetical protein
MVRISQRRHRHVSSSRKSPKSRIQGEDPYNRLFLIVSQLLRTNALQSRFVGEHQLADDERR